MQRHLDKRNDLEQRSPNYFLAKSSGFEKMNLGAHILVHRHTQKQIYIIYIYRERERERASG